MLRSLILMRHGNAEDYSSCGADHGRKLTGLGKNQVISIAKQFRQSSVVPSNIICSSAARAFETWNILKEHAEIELHAEVTRELYEPSDEAIFSQLEALPDECQTALLVGHNPVWSTLVSVLTDSYTALATADAVLIRRDLDCWSNVSSARGWDLVQHYRA